MVLGRRCHCPAAIVAAGLALLRGSAAGTASFGKSCLDDAVPPDSLKSLVVDGVTMPIGIWQYNWDSARMFSTIYALIARDVLGYEVVRTGETDSFLPGMLALAGCESPTNITDPQCRNSPAQRTHVVLEFWNSDIHTIGWLQVNYPANVPEDVGSVGYASREGLYVREADCKAAEANDDLQLQNYFFYGNTKYNVRKYFDDYQSIPTSDLLPCNQSALSQSALVSSVAQFYPDPATFVEGAAGLQAKCADGYWWLSPACRASPSRCIPFVTNADWYVKGTLQRAIAHRMPLAVAIAADDVRFAALPHEYRVTFYWWEPDRTFLDLSPVQIVFPPYNSREWAQGNSESNAPDALLTKNVYRKFSAVAPKAYHVAKQISLDMTTLRLLLGELDAVNGDVGAVACSWVRANRPTWQAWLPKATECPTGYGLVDVANAYVGGRATAVDCAPCSTGSYSEPLVDEDGLTHVCRRCTPGQVQPQRGSDKCEQCEAGYFQNATGQSLCMRCDKGTFTTDPGSPNCTTCPLGKTTDGSGFRSEADCQCPPGTYSAEGSGACLVCGEGARCPGFGAAPTALPGYQLVSVGDDGLSIFECFGGAARCVGGGLGGCAEGREGIACALCRRGMTSASGGTCKPCGPGDSAPFAVVFILALVLLVAMYRKISMEDRAKQSSGTLILVANWGQLIMLLQVIGTFTRLSLAWPEPLHSVLVFLRLFALDIQVLRMDCVGTSRPLSRYLATICLLPGGLAWLALIHYSAQLLKRVLRLANKVPLSDSGPSTQSADALVGSAGTLFMALFIAVVTATMAPLQCQQHPNGLWTMVEYESVLCWRGGVQTAMIAVGMCVMLLPAAFVAAVVYIIRAFPEKMQRGDVRFLNTFAFLFSRVKPGARWFVLGFLLRNLALAFIPAIPQTFTQMVLLQAIFWGSLLLILAYAPWRVPSSNRLDFATHLGMACFVNLTAYFVSSANLSFVALIAAVMIAGGLAALAVAAGASTMRLLLVPRKRFQFFLCHQKSAAGAMARLLKMALLEGNRPKGDVFIDSDNLEDLEQLFNVVAHHTVTLVVLSSKELLRRTWCLGEIVTASINDVETLVVRFPDFVPPDDAFINGIDSIVEVNILSEGGLSIAQAQHALEWFRDLDYIAMPAALSRQVIAAIVPQLYAKKPTTEPLPNSHFLRHAHLEAQAAVLSDTTDGEATAAALILQTLLVPHLEHEPALVPVLFDELVLAGGAAGLSHMSMVLVLCTAGCFKEPAFLSALVACLDEGITTALPIVVRDDFRFPTPAFYVDLERDAARLAPQPVGDGGVGLLIRYVELMFKKIALTFNTMASLQVLESQASSIERRMVQATMGSRTSMNSTASSEPFQSRKSSGDVERQSVGGSRSGSLGVGDFGLLATMVVDLDEDACEWY